MAATTGTAASNPKYGNDGLSYTLAPELGNSAAPVSSQQYCVDFTVHRNVSVADRGYLEFQLIVEKTSQTNPAPEATGPGNLKILSIVPTAYYVPNSNGILIAPGGTAGTAGVNYAIPVTVTSNNVGSTSSTVDGDDSMIKGGLTFEFLYSGTYYRVTNFTESNNPTISTLTGSGGSVVTNVNCNGSCDVVGTFASASREDIFLGYPTANELGFGNPNAIPEISAGNLPKGLLLLSMIYMLVIRQRRVEAKHSR